MADLNPLEPGDVPYPQYSVTTTQPVDAIPVVKGVVYTKNAAGDLVAVVATLVDGIYQATADIEVAGTAGENSVQCLGPRSRMVFTTQIAGLIVGEDVYVVPTTTDVTNIVAAALYLGKIFEIYTLNSDSTSKKITEVGDKVIVETVGP